MKTYVMDTSVLAAFFFREELAGQAESYITTHATLLAPDFLHIEFANVLWKHAHRKELSETESSDLFIVMQQLPIQLVSSSSLITDAIKLAFKTKRTIYDCLYVALAIQNRCQMVTTDQRLVNALSQTAFGQYVHWIGK